MTDKLVAEERWRKGLDRIDEFRFADGKLQAENKRLKKQLAEARAREATAEKVEAARVAVMDMLMFHFPPVQMTGIWPKVEAAIAEAFGVEKESEASE